MKNKERFLVLGCTWLEGNQRTDKIQNVHQKPKKSSYTSGQDHKPDTKILWVWFLLKRYTNQLYFTNSRNPVTLNKSYLNNIYYWNKCSDR